jgi:uncharacterized membrane protein YhiD involved in acid resistance
MGKNSFIDFQDYFFSLSPDSVVGFSINIFLAIILSTLLARIYVMYGKSYSDRRVLSRTFIMITLTTMLVITVVKSSLALSLGLVGALSIVRFRTPIKEPEELGYLFLAIAIGLGLGAASREVTLTMTSVIFILVWLRSKRENTTGPYPNLSLIISSDSNEKSREIIDIDKMVDIVKKYASRVDVVRFEDSENRNEMSLYIEVDSFSMISDIRGELKSGHDGLEIIFIDNTAGKII